MLFVLGQEDPASPEDPSDFGFCRGTVRCDPTKPNCRSPELRQVPDVLLALTGLVVCKRTAWSPTVPPISTGGTKLHGSLCTSCSGSPPTLKHRIGTQTIGQKLPLFTTGLAVCRQASLRSSHRSAWSFLPCVVQSLQDLSSSGLLPKIELGGEHTLVVWVFQLREGQSGVVEMAADFHVTGCLRRGLERWRRHTPFPSLYWHSSLSCRGHSIHPYHGEPKTLPE